MRLPPYIDISLSKMLSTPTDEVPDGSSESSESMDEPQYVPWTANEEHLKNEKYCCFDALVDILRFIKEEPFDDMQFRTRSLELLQNLQRKSLVGKNKRFPELGTNVNLTSGMYAQLMKDIMTCLKCTRNNHTLDQAHLCNCNEIFSLRVDYILYLTNTIPSSQLYYYGTYTRDTFEKWFALKWI